MKKLILIIYLLSSLFGISQTNNLTYFNSGLDLYNQGKYSEAISQFKLIIENGEHSDALYFNLGNSYYKINDLANSIYYFEKALKLNPNDKDVLNNLSFSQNKDFISDIYDFDENISLIINVDNIYPSKVEDLESVYEIVLNDFINSKKLELAQNLFDNNKNDNNLIAINSIFNLEIEELNTKLNSNDITSILNNSIANSELNKINFSSDEKNIYFFKVKLSNVIL